jgi:hypothetical protein
VSSPSDPTHNDEIEIRKPQRAILLKRVEMRVQLLSQLWINIAMFVPHLDTGDV